MQEIFNMEQKQENIKENEKAPVSSLKGWIYICLGIILIALSIIGATGKTWLGSIIVYFLAYIIGVFYPFVLALFFLFGLTLVVSRKTWAFKNHSLYWIGAIFTFVAVLAFGSYSMFSSNTISLSSMNSFYSDKMQAFARSPMQIDSFDSIGALGGGYIGLFMIVLLGSVWGNVGNIIFFSFILVIGVILLALKPTIQLLNVIGIGHLIKRVKEKKVEYSSPYQPQKKKETIHMSRSSEYEEKQFDDDEKNQEEIIAPQTKFSDEVTRPFKQDSPKNDDDAFSFYDNDNFTFTPKPNEPETYEDNISSREDSPNFTQEPVSQTKSNIDDKESISSTLISNNKDDDYFESPQSHFSTVNPFTEKAPQKMKPVDDDPFASAYEPSKPKIVEQIPVQSQTLKPQVATPVLNEYSKPKQSEPILSQTTYVKPVSNPLENVVPSTPAKENKTIEYSVNTPIIEKTVEETKPIIEEKKPELTEAEIEERKISDYFALKQQKQAETLLAKKRQKEEKIASLMKFVPDTPKFYAYPLPNDLLLEEIDDSAKIEKNSQSAKEKAAIINQVFDEFGIKAKATSYTMGSSVTRFNVETEHGEKADRIATLTNEFQRALNGDMSVRVETVVEGKTTSGIEVGNIAPMAVSFKDVFQEIEQNTKDPLLLPIGKDISGNIVTFPLNKMPHMLVAGTTGSGKSVLVHSMIMTLIMRTYPSQCKLMLIDPKQVEFIRYQGCSHLFCPVISKPESAILALKKLCDEMDRRFTVLSKACAANLEDYEELRKNDEMHHYEEMPYIVTVIDEFADLMQTGGPEVTKYVTRIAQKARACGIHLIIATQRPSKDNVPMIIKANVPCRIGLSCSSSVDSRVILDEVGAETLLGKGDLLFKNPAKKSLIRAQSPFISNKDITTILNYVKEKAGDPCYDPNFLDLDVDEQNDDDNVVEGDIYSEIKDFVIGTGITSKATLMRSFQISSSKADQFIARLQSDSIITYGPNGKYVLGPAAHLEEY